MQQRVYAKGPAEIGIVDGRPAIRGECDLSNRGRNRVLFASIASAGRRSTWDLSGVTFFSAAAFASPRRRLAAVIRTCASSNERDRPARSSSCPARALMLIDGHDTLLAAAVRRQ